MKAAVFQALQAARGAKQPAVLATDLKSGRQLLIGADGERLAGELSLNEELAEVAQQALAEDRSAMDPDRGLFLQVFNPPLRLVVVGAVHIAQALVPMAQTLGYAVTVIDPRRAWASAERFPGIALTHDWPDEALEALKPDSRTAIVALTHDPKLDDPALTLALRSPAFYIGALGSRKTHEKRRQRLAEAGVSEAAFARIDGPIGLAIGARSPAEIALSILAKITQVRRGAAELKPVGA
jgi:xanthine dehydrogenase accessory factor